MRFTGGLPETRCGLGSTLRYTEDLRADLPLLLYSLEVKTLLDIPCGDFNWMAHTDLSDIRYTGWDIDGDNCWSAEHRPSVPWGFAPKTKKIVHCDAVTTPWPRHDAVLCRDFFQHIPNKDVAACLQMFVDSGSTWMLATNFTSGKADEIEAKGKFRELDLTAPPFSLTEPKGFLEDGSGRVLAIWRRDAVAGGTFD
jgi:hypothetical protein